MSQSVASSAAATGGPHVCTACPMLCDDIRSGGMLAEVCCASGAAAFAAACGDGADLPEGWIGGAAATREAALDRAAAALCAARRVLVSGLAGGTLESIARACDLAEAVGAAVDAGSVETSRAAGPTIARSGGVTADWEELRDRADLVVFWFCDPAATHPRFLERFVTPSAAGGPRRTIAIGPDAVLPDGPTHSHFPVSGTLAVEAARAWQAKRSGLGDDDTSLCGPVRVACDALDAALGTASCMAVVTGPDAAADVGLGPWSVVGLVRSIARVKPAFQIPLAAGVRAGGGNVAGAAAVCTWRFGAVGAIARADRRGADFLPGECDAQHLIRRREVDCVVAVGDLTAAVEAEIAARRADLDVVRLTAACGPVADGPREIQVRCVSPWVFPTGAMLREDGRHVLLGTTAETARPDALPSLLAALHARVHPAVMSPGGGTR